MALTIKEYADQIRQQVAGYEDWDDHELSRWYLTMQPSSKELIDSDELNSLYGIRPEHRGSDTKYAIHGFKEMFNGIPSAVVGSIGAALDNEDIVNYSETLRKGAHEKSLEWLKDPEIAGYQAWMEDEPIGWDNFYQFDMMQRGLAQAAPSVASMIAVDVGMNYLTGGLFGMVSAATKGKKFFEAAQIIKKGRETYKASQKAGKALSLAEKSGRAASHISTASTMGFMGVLEGTEQYNSTMDYLATKGLDPLQASKVAATSAAIYGTLAGIEEYIPYGRFKKVFGVGSKYNADFLTKKIADSLKNKGFWKTGASITEEAIKQAMAEAGQEYSQFMTQQAVNHFIKDEYGDVPQSFFLDMKQQALTPEGIESAYSGGIMGWLMGGLGGIRQQSKRARLGEAYENIDRAVQAGDITKEDGEALKEDVPAKIEAEERAKNQREAIVTLKTFAGRADDLTSDEDKKFAAEIQSNLDNPKKKRKISESILDTINNDPSAIESLFPNADERFELLQDLAVNLGEEDPTGFVEKFESKLASQQTDINIPVEDTTSDDQTDIKDPTDIAEPEDPTDIKDPEDIAREQEIKRYSAKKIRKELKKLGLEPEHNGKSIDVQRLIDSDYNPVGAPIKPTEEQPTSSDVEETEETKSRSLEYENVKFDLNSDGSVSAFIDGTEVDVNESTSRAVANVMRNDKADGSWLKGAANNLRGKQKQASKKVDSILPSKATKKVKAEELVGGHPAWWANQKAQIGESSLAYANVVEALSESNKFAKVYIKKLQNLIGVPLTEMEKKGYYNKTHEDATGKILYSPLMNEENMYTTLEEKDVFLQKAISILETRLESSSKTPKEEKQIKTEQPDPTDIPDPEDKGGEDISNLFGGKKQGDYGSGNKVFTKDKADKAREELKKSLGQANMGLDPKQMSAAVTLAGYHIEAGARSFKAFSEAMIGDLGNVIKKHLKQLYNMVRDDSDTPDALRQSMDSYDSVVTQDASEGLFRMESPDGHGWSNRPKTEQPNPVGDGGWARKSDNGYEVSSRGDKRFSALFAKLKDGRTIEKAYQEAKGSGKGEPSIHKNFDYWGTYKGLWEQWAKENPELIEELRVASEGKVLTDMFANTENNQARALSEILKQSQPAKGVTKTKVKTSDKPADDVPSVIGSTIYELEPDITSDKIKQIYDNYVALMNVKREGKALSLHQFKSLLKVMSVYKYKNTYIFGVYDSEVAVFTTKLNSSPTSKELLAEAIPNLVSKGVDFISFVPKDVANKYVRSGYVQSNGSFDYDFKGEKMVKYAVASNENIFNKIFNKSSKEITGKDILGYSSSSKLKYSPLRINPDDIAKANKDVNRILSIFLKKFGIKVKEIKNIQKELGIDSVGFADILNKIAYIENKEDLPPVAGEFIAYMMQYNPLVSDIIKEMSGTNEYKKLDKSKYLKVIGELIAKDLSNKLEGNYKKSLISKIQELIKLFFDKLKNVPVDKINRNIGIISNNIMQQNEKLITATLFKPGSYGKEITTVSIEKSLKSDSFGSKIIYALSKRGLILTGSTALSEQGLILRPSDNLLHDIDWVSPFTREETVALFLDEYPEAKKVREIFSDEGYTTDTYVIAPDGYIVEDLVLTPYTDKNGKTKISLDSYNVIDKSTKKVSGRFDKVKNDKGVIEELVTGVEAKVIDLFSYDDYSKSVTKQPIVYKDSSGVEIKISHWSMIFRAKLKMARMKDLWDYNRFILNKTQKNNNSNSNILDARTEKINYTNDQKNALNMIADVIDSDSDNIAVLAGYAGTGKTTIIQNIIKYANDTKGSGVSVTALTNKAVLRALSKMKEDVGEHEAVGASYSTIHKAFYAKNRLTGAWEFKSEKLGSNDLLIVDEASMLPKWMIRDIVNAAILSGAKVVFMGDGFQLPPVNAKDPMLLIKGHQVLGKNQDGSDVVAKYYQMREVVRQGAGSFVTVWATALRFRKKLHFPSKTVNADGGPVLVQKKTEFAKSFFDAVKADADAVMIVFTNAKRNIINKLARKKKFGEDATDKSALLPGEKLISLANASSHVNSEEFELGKDWDAKLSPQRVHVKVEGEYGQTSTQKMNGFMTLDDRGYPMLLVMNNKESSIYHTDIANLDSFPEEFVDNSHPKYPKLSDSVTIATYGYAITAHKAQGSEWKDVWIGQHKDFYDPDTETEADMARWLYTAITRTSGSIHILKQGKDEQTPENIKLMYNAAQRQAKKEASINEDLQEINDNAIESSKIKNNKELADKITKRLKKQFPFITAEAVQRVYDRFGREVAGKAIDRLVQWSIEEGTLDTIPHEYAHIYIRLLGDDVWVKKAIEKFHGEEQLVEYIGQYYVSRVKNDKIHNAIGAWLKQFWLNIKKRFVGLSEKEYGDLLGEKFYQASISKTTADLSGQERLQEIAYGSQQWRNITTGLNAAYNSYVSMLRRDGVLSRGMTKDEKVGIVANLYNNVLASERISHIIEPVLRNWAINKGFNPDDNIAPMRVESFINKTEYEALYQDIADGIVDEDIGDTNLKELNRINSTIINGWGVIGNSALQRMMAMINVNSRDEWVWNFIAENSSVNPNLYFDDDAPRANKQKVNDLKLFYNSVKASYATNREKKEDNVKTSLMLDVRESSDGDMESMSISRKGPNNKHTNRSNPKSTRKMLIEQVLYNLGDEIAWIAAKDIWSTRAKKKYGSHPAATTYNALDYDGLRMLQKELRKIGLVIAFNRGDSELYGVAKVTDRHKELAKDPKAYWDEQNLTDTQISEFMGEQFGDKVDLLFHAEEIARYEALETLLPNHMSFPATTVMKRIKIPTTPSISISGMPDIFGKIYNPENAKFVFSDGKAVSAMRDIPGVAKKYILDGSSLTSTRLFQLFATHVGVNALSAKAKTVIANVDDMFGTLFVKHQHFKPLHEFEIRDGYVDENNRGTLIATVGRDGNITDPSGEIIHVLLTKDEAKITEGYYKDQMDAGEIFEIPGSSIGHINTSSARHDKAKFPLQLLNYIHYPPFIEAFKEELLPQIKKKASRVFDLAKGLQGKKAPQLISEFMSALKGDDSQLPSYVYSIFKLGLGQHPAGLKLLNKLVQTRLMTRALEMRDMPGLDGDIIADVRDDLDVDEVNVPWRSASIIRTDFEKANPHMTANRTNVNNWLNNTPYYMLISRSPVPSLTGGKIVRINFIHNNNNAVELNPILIFRELEGDGDGDHVSLVKLPPKTEKALIDLYSKVEVEGINLDKYTKGKREYSLSNRADLLSIISAMTFGGKAIAEIANIQNLYGMLQENVKSIKVAGHDIKLRGPKEIITDDASGIKGNIDKILRVYLQAAVDNVEFMLLAGWEYDRAKLIELLFEIPEIGNTNPELKSELISGLKPLLSTFRTTSHIIGGQDFNKGKYGLDDTIRESGFYRKFLNNRTKYIGSESIKGLPLDVQFKKGKLHLFEYIAKIPADLYFDKFIGQDKALLSFYNLSPYVLHDGVSMITHQETAVQIKQDMINEFSDVYHNEVAAGQTYADGMGLELYEMIGAMSTDKSGDVLMDVTLGWDTNEELIKFADKWKKEYSKLTDLERRAATYVFFNGVFRYSLDPQGKRRYDKKGIVKYSRVINPEYFPPISDNPLETTLLHPDVASIFFKKYNDNLHSRIIKEKAVKKQFDKKPTGRGILQDITLVDKTINKEC